MAALRHGIIHVCFVLVWMVICFPVVTFQRSVNTTTTPVHHKDDVPFNLTPVGKILINGSIVGIVVKVMYHIVICISFKKRRSHLVFTDRLRKEFAKRESFQTVEQCCCCKYCVCFGILGINCLFRSYVWDRFCGSSVDSNPSSQTSQTPESNDKEIKPILIEYTHVERIVNDFVNYRLGYKRYQFMKEDHNNFATKFKAVTYLFVLDFNNTEVKKLGTPGHVDAADVVWLSLPDYVKAINGKVNKKYHPNLHYMKKRSKEICLIVLNTSKASDDAMNVVKKFLQEYRVTLYYSSDSSVITKEPRSCFGIGCCCSKNESSKNMEEQNLLANTEQPVSCSTGNGESSGTKEIPLQLNPDVSDGNKSGSIQMSDLSNHTKVLEENMGTLKDEQRGLSNRTEVLEENMGKLTDEQKEQDVDYNKLTSLSALNIVTQLIGADWNFLSKKLKIAQNFNETISDEEKMMKCFEQADNRIYWKELKYQLEQLKRQDIIAEIASRTCCTHGLEKYSKKLREYYKKSLTHWNIASAFKSDSGREYTAKDRNEAYVDLVVGPWNNTYTSDHEHFLKTHSVSKEKVEMKDIVKESDGCVLIRGIAGIGKTSLIDQLVFQWADGKIMNDFDFVFKFACRELNTLTSISSWGELVQRFFPTIYEGLIDELNESSSRVLVILDGIDEFRYLQDIKELSAGNPTHSFAHIIHDIIVHKMSLLPNSNVIVCGRPQACDTIKGIVQITKKPKLIEVSGFDKNSIEIYVDKFFKGNKEKTQSIHTSLNELRNLKAMAHIPVYLHTICNVYASEKKMEDLNTTTKLNIAACLVFLRDHMREFKGKNYSLTELSQDQDILKMIKKTSQFAFKSLQEKKILFSQTEFKDGNSDNLKSIEQSGIIEKVEGGEDGDFYQFKHLVLQEFLSSCYIFFDAVDIKKDMLDLENLRNCLPFVAGLHGISEDASRGPNYIRQFVKGIIEPSTLGSVEVLFKKTILLAEDTTHYDAICDAIFLSPDVFKLLLHMVYEYHGDVIDSVKNYFFEQHNMKTIWINYHYALTHLIYFF